MMWRRIRTYLGAGLFVVLPAVITGYVLWFIFRLTDGLLGSILERFCTGGYLARVCWPCCSCSSWPG